MALSRTTHWGWPVAPPTRAGRRPESYCRSPRAPQKGRSGFPRVTAHALLRRDAFLGQQLPQVGLVTGRLNR